MEEIILDKLDITKNPTDWHLVFDVGDCIIHERPQWIAENYEGGKYKNLFKLIGGQTWKNFDAGKFTFPEICDHYAALFKEKCPNEKEMHLSADQVKEMIEFAWHNLNPNWPMINFVKYLRRQGFENIHLLTNGARGYFDIATKSDNYVFDWQFSLYLLANEHNVIVSADHEMRKPEKQIYELAKEKWNLVDPSKVIFIDNSESYIKAAEEFGWHGVLYDKTNDADFFKQWENFGIHYEPTNDEADQLVEKIAKLPPKDRDAVIVRAIYDSGTKNWQDMYGRVIKYDGAPANMPATVFANYYPRALPNASAVVTSTKGGAISILMVAKKRKPTQLTFPEGFMETGNPGYTKFEDRELLDKAFLSSFKKTVKDSGESYDTIVQHPFDPTQEHTARREAKEEADVDLSSVKAKLIFTGTFYSTGNHLHQVGHTYHFRCGDEQPKPKPDGEEIGHAEWIDAKEMVEQEDGSAKHKDFFFTDIYNYRLQLALRRVRNKEIKVVSGKQYKKRKDFILDLKKHYESVAKICAEETRQHVSNLIQYFESDEVTLFSELGEQAHDRHNKLLTVIKIFCDKPLFLSADAAVKLFKKMNNNLAGCKSLRSKPTLTKASNVLLKHYEEMEKIGRPEKTGLIKLGK